MDVKSVAWKLATLALLVTLPAVNGCAGLWSTLVYWKDGQLIPAEYDFSDGQRVAVVCVVDGSSYGSGSEATELSREIRLILRQRLSDVELVRADEIADWVDREGWDQIDYREIGRGVKADQVVAIDLQGLQLYEGSSLYNGQADVTVTVFDMQDGGAEAFRKTLPEFRFPETGPYPVGDMSQAKFRRAFLQALAAHIAKYFHSYDMVDDFGRDSAFIGG